jgi:hypothetical protein
MFEQRTTKPQCQRTDRVCRAISQVQRPDVLNTPFALADLIVCTKPLARRAQALRDFDQTGRSTPAQSALKRAPARKARMKPEGRRKLAEAMKRRWAARRTAAQAKKKQPDSGLVAEA